MACRSDTPSLSFTCCFLVTFLLCYSTCKADLTTDAAALLAFKSTVAPPNNSAVLLTWTSYAIANICISWEGVGCSGTDQNQRVTSLRLPGKSLKGPISSDTLSNLDQLNTLSLRSNKLSGTLPSDLANCTGLVRIYLQRNNLSGPLSSINFSAWPSLALLDLSSNAFTDSIPSLLASLRRLKSLFLVNNSLSGSIPDFSGLPLVTFSVAGNELSGTIPSSLARFPADSFYGNPGLCGTPLAVECATDVEEASSNLRAGVVVGIVFACIAALLVALLLVFMIVHRKNAAKMKRSKAINMASKREDQDNEASRSDAVKKPEVASRLVMMGTAKHLSFDLDDLLRASAEVLGKGSVGTTYKAALADGGVVAVKRMRDATTLEEEEFCRRMETLGNLQHPNLVALHAFYYGPHEKLLVFDFIANGSLSSLLHGDKSGPPDWEGRLALAVGVARGLAYLHSRGEVHADIKLTNVLITAGNQPCLSDYGLSPLICKFLGHVAPEVPELRKVRPEADVYSFGVLLLELLTGKDADVSGIDLPRWAHTVLHDDRTSDVFDVEMLKTGNEPSDEMVAVLRIALLCASPAPESRPPMADVVTSLENLRKKSAAALHVQFSAREQEHEKTRDRETAQCLNGECARSPA